MTGRSGPWAMRRRIGIGLVLCGLSLAGCEQAKHEDTEQADPVFYGTLVSVNGRKAATDKVELTLWPTYLRVAAVCGLDASYADGVVTQVHEPAPAIGPCTDQDLKDVREAEAVIQDHPRIDYQREEAVTLRGRSGGVAVFHRTAYMDFHPE